MYIQRHPQTNHTYGKPGDMTDEQCASLPVVLYRDPEGTWANSFWKPDPVELAALNEGGAVMLRIRVGSGDPNEPVGHPVVAVGVTAHQLEDA